MNRLLKFASLLCVGAFVAGPLVVAPAVADALPAGCVASGGVVTCTYTTVGEHTFVVPTGVTQASFTATGGAGGSYLTGSTVNQPGGRAATITVPSHPVTPGATLYVEVGGRGLANTETDSGGLNGGANGGGRGRTPGIAGGGGGAADIRTTPATAGLSPTDPRLLIAAGGGGAGGLGGSGGARGDADSAGGAGFGSPNSGGAAGQPGGTSAPGAGASDGGATAGTLGQGGDGGYCGGGGGGGFYGGGGGNNASSSSCSSAGSGPTAGGGGGGGSSLVPAGGSYALAAFSAAPQVVIAYNSSATTPVRAKVPDRNFTEGAKAHVEKFVVRLSDATASDVAVDFHTVDGTATAGADYVATSGRMTIPAGSKVGALRVRILGNSTPQSNRAFSLVIANPTTNARIVDDTGVGTILDDD
jgi:Calx-beta domain-containing protein